jgi:hypothetical protein
MLIDVKALAEDYTYVGIVERTIGKLIGNLVDLPVTDFTEDVARPEYDFLVGDLPVELKITDGFMIPVEMSKGEDGSVPSGVAVTKAPYVLYISNGRARDEEGEGHPAAKVRLFETNWLIKTAKQIEPRRFKGPKASEDANVHYIKGPWHNKDIWLGDMQYAESGGRWFIDTDTFTPSRQAIGAIQLLEQEYRDGSFD